VSNVDVLWRGSVVNIGGRRLRRPRRRERDATGVEWGGGWVSVISCHKRAQGGALAARHKRGAFLAAQNASGETMA